MLNHNQTAMVLVIGLVGVLVTSASTRVFAQPGHDIHAVPFILPSSQIEQIPNEENKVNNALQSEENKVNNGADEHYRAPPPPESCIVCLVGSGGGAGPGGER
jgi:hypothetical protein